MLCQPKPFASNIPPSEFPNLTLSQLTALLQEVGKQKREHEGKERLSSYAAGYSAIQAAQKYRRDNNIECPPNKDKEEFYGIWPFSKSIS